MRYRAAHGSNVSNNTKRLNVVQRPLADFLDWRFLTALGHGPIH